MKAKYFQDTDTLLLTFSDQDIVETYDLNEDVLVEPEEAFVPIESTEYWEEMEKNRVGNLLSGARLKAGLTQAELADKLGIRQNMVSDYERGRRTYSDDMAKRLSKTLKVKEEHLRHGSEQFRHVPK